VFQSTLPMKGATNQGIIVHSLTDVSIHAPNEGSDSTSSAASYRGLAFQSTLPMKGATRANGEVGMKVCVSIHAPNEGSDTISPGASASFT